MNSQYDIIFNMDKKEIRILYFGTPEISANTLKNIINEGYNIVGVIAQEDKPNARGNKVEEVATKKVAKEYNIPVFQFHKVKEHAQEIRELKPDLILTLAYGQIISHEILEIPTYGSLNLHGSILPKYRGAAPIQYALLNGDKETGVTLMEMVDKMDAGRMYAIEKIKIEDDDNYDSLNDKVSNAAFICFNNNIQNYLNGTLEGIPQKEEDVTFTGKIKSEDEIINFNDKSFNIVNKIRALSTKPGAYFIFNNIKYKVFKAKISNEIGNAGEILKYNKKEFVIGTLDSSISIEIIQKPGKKAMNFKDFFNGNSKLFEEKMNLND